MPKLEQVAGIASYGDFTLQQITDYLDIGHQGCLLVREYVDKSAYQFLGDRMTGAREV